MNANGWTLGNDRPAWRKPGSGTLFFLYRRTARGTEYLETPAGKLRTFRKREAAVKFLAKINGGSNECT